MLEAKDYCGYWEMSNFSDTNNTSKIKGLRIKIRELFIQNGFLRKYTKVFFNILRNIQAKICKLFTADI
jgi:hypothetical protein